MFKSCEPDLLRCSSALSHKVLRYRPR